MSEWLRVSEPFQHVLHVELNRAPVNAFSPKFYTAYGEFFNSLAEDPKDTRAVVISSAFPAIFTAGLDLTKDDTTNLSVDPYRHAILLREHLAAFQNAIRATEKCPVPVIAAVHGKAIGLGVDMICSCDIRYASSDTVFIIAEVNVGLASDIGTLAYLPKIASNQSLVRELAMSARPFSAAVAHEQLGLLSKVVPGGKDDVVKEALELAKLIATKSPVAVSSTKRILNHARDHSVEENLEYTGIWNSVALQSQDTRVAIEAALKKRQSIFVALKEGRAKL